MSGVEADPTELRLAADRISAQAWTVRERAAELGHLHPSALDQAVEAVVRRLHHHAADLEVLAQRLRVAAADYDRVDADGAAAFREIADGLR